MIIDLIIMLFFVSYSTDGCILFSTLLYTSSNFIPVLALCVMFMLSAI